MRLSSFWLSLLLLFWCSGLSYGQTGQQSPVPLSVAQPVSLAEAVERIKKAYPPSIPVFLAIADEVDLIASDLQRSEQALSEAQVLLDSQSKTLEQLKTELSLQGTLLSQVAQEREAYRQAYEGQKWATIVAVGVGVGVATFLLLAPK